MCEQFEGTFNVTKVRDGVVTIEEKDNDDDGEVVKRTWYKESDARELMDKLNATLQPKASP